MSLRRAAALLLLAVVLITAAGVAHQQASRRRSFVPTSLEIAFLPRTEVLRAASLGHPELMADLLFIRTLTYFGTQIEKVKNYDWLPGHLETTFELDPWFRGAYRFAGLATMYNGLPITNVEVGRSIHFLEMGLSRFPSDWEMAFMLGCNYLFELKTEDAADKARFRRVGADWIRRAAVSGGPGWLPGLAATLMSREGRTEAALRYLEEAYLTAPDDRAREEIGRMLLARREGSMAALQAARDRFIAAWRQALPYAPADLYVLVGDPPPARLDWRFLARSGAVERALSGSDDEPAPDDGADERRAP